MYLGAEDTRQRILEAERLSDAVDESNGTRDYMVQTTRKQLDTWW